MLITKVIGKRSSSRGEKRPYSKVALEPRNDYGIINAMAVNPLMLRGLFQG